jgi:hypothetical protein
MKPGLVPFAVLLGSLALPAIAAPQPATDPALRHACPQIDAALQDMLYPVARRAPVPQRLRVQFRLSGQQISEIDSQGGSEAQRIHVRRAVAKLPCYSEAAQLLSFDLELSRG